jgi:hypothetical protein
MFGNLGKKVASARKFLCTNSNSYVQWQVDADGDSRFVLHDGRETVVFSEWVSGGTTKDVLDFDKKMGILVDEINAMRKAVKTKIAKK